MRSCHRRQHTHTHTRSAHAHAPARTWRASPNARTQCTDEGRDKTGADRAQRTSRSARHEARAHTHTHTHTQTHTRTTKHARDAGGGRTRCNAAVQRRTAVQRRKLRGGWHAVPACAACGKCGGRECGGGGGGCDGGRGATADAGCNTKRPQLRVGLCTQRTTDGNRTVRDGRQWRVRGRCSSGLRQQDGERQRLRRQAAGTESHNNNNGNDGGGATDGRTGGKVVVRAAAGKAAHTARRRMAGNSPWRTGGRATNLGLRGREMRSTEQVCVGSGGGCGGGWGGGCVWSRGWGGGGERAAAVSRVPAGSVAARSTQPNTCGHLANGKAVSGARGCRAVRGSAGPDAVQQAPRRQTWETAASFYDLRL